jgi:hypothetical protein
MRAEGMERLDCSSFPAALWKGRETEGSLEGDLRSTPERIFKVRRH